MSGKPQDLDQIAALLAAALIGRSADERIGFTVVALGPDDVVKTFFEVRERLQAKFADEETAGMDSFLDAQSPT